MKTKGQSGGARYARLGGDTLTDGRTVSVLTLFRFSTACEKIIMLTGSVFAILEGAGPAIMALVFGGMTNTLIQTVQMGFAPPTQPVADNVTTVAPTVLPTPTANATIVMLTAEEFEAKMSTFAAYYALIGVAVYLSSLIQMLCWQTACERQSHRIRRAFFRSILRQELAWFDSNQAGELSAKLNDDIERVRDGIGEQFSAIIKQSSSFGSGFLVGFIVSWRLTLVILAATPLLAMFSAFLGRMMATSTKREQEKYASAGALAEETLVAIRTVFSLGGQRSEINNYSNKLHEGRRMAQGKYLKLSFFVGASMFVLYATYGLALYFSTILLMENQITPGSAMTVIMAVMMGASALGNIIPPMQTIMMAISSMTLIVQIIDTKPKINASADRGLKLAKVRANIRLDRVKFCYPTRDRVPVLKSLSLELKEGQRVAICGKTGSGKSTIINMLLRFYDPDEGNIYLDGYDYRELNVAWLRSLIGIVEQEPTLFDCSILENISLGASRESDKSFARVQEAAKMANAHEFIINLPSGYNTRCGDRGFQMSGGQKQRIAIARALLGNPKILLLDEATSALDSESEFMVQMALNKACQGRTTVIIAHRLSTIRDADIICVMDAGQIVEMGRHDELMANKSEYYNLVTNQVFTEELSSSDGDGNTPSAISEGRDSQVAEDEAEAHDADEDTDDLERKSTAGGPMQQPQVTVQRDRPARRRSSAVVSEASTVGRRSVGGHDTTGSSRPRRLSKSSQSTTMYESVNRAIGGRFDISPEAMSQRSADEEVQLPTIGDIYRLVKPEFRYLLPAVVASIVTGALLPAFALFYAQILDTLTKTGPELTEAGKFWALMFVVLAAANFLFMFMRILLTAMTLEHMMVRIRTKCYENILRQHVGWFDMPTNTPQRLTTRLASDVPMIKSVLNSRVTTLISGVATVLAALFIAFYLGWQLAILLAAALPILLYVGYFQMLMSRGDRSKHTKRMENASRLATEAIENVKVVQALNQENFFHDKFRDELKGPYDESIKAARRFGLVYGLSQSCIYFVYGAAFRWGAFLIARDQLDPITVFRIFFSIAFTAVAVGQWGGIGGDMSRANYAIAMVLRLLSTKPAIDNLSRGGIKPRFKGQINLMDLYFRYPGRPQIPVLNGLNLSIEPGQTLAIVGPSGQGKSTIASLLLRFYDPDRGTVRIDNYDIRCINLNHLRHNIGLVSQEPILFKTTIKENILYGLDQSKYSMREVINAAKLANIHDFIQSLPDGYDTQVGDRGTQLSGGQKQRIAIARTMVRNPSILIFDEATSALDSESEALVNLALEKAAHGKTCIKIAHRLSTVRSADKIAVLQKGIVVELGTHSELMALGSRGHYYNLMQKQEISS